jgi:hypothetical protein
MSALTLLRQLLTKAATMCNLKAKQTSNVGHNRLGSMSRRNESSAPMIPAAAPRIEATPAITCSACRAIHYQASLACRKCGEYFAPAERPAVVPLLLAPTVAATAAAIVGILATIMLGVV